MFSARLPPVSTRQRPAQLNPDPTDTRPKGKRWLSLPPSVQDPPPQSSFPLPGPVTSWTVDRGSLSLGEDPTPARPSWKLDPGKWVAGRVTESQLQLDGGSISGRGWVAAGPALALAGPWCCHYPVAASRPKVSPRRPAGCLHTQSRPWVGWKSLIVQR